MTKKESILMIIFVLTPLIVSITNMINISSNLIWYIPNIIMIYIALKNIKLKNVDNKIKILLYIFLILNLISCIFAKDKVRALLGGYVRLTGYITLISFIGYFEIGSRLKDKELKLITTIIIYVSAIISVIMLIKTPITYIMFNQNPKEYYFYEGPFNQFNHTAYYLLITSIICIFKILKEKKIIYYILNIIILYTLIINDTFGAYVAYTITILLISIYYIFKKQNLKEIIIILSTFLILSSVTYRNNENIVYKNIRELVQDTKTIQNNNIEEIYTVGTDRGKLWINGLKIIKNHPLIGVGLENEVYEYKKYEVYNAKPHNIILEITMESGIPSLIIYIFIMYEIYKNKEKNDTSIAVTFIIIAYLLSSMFGNITMYVTPYYYLFLGILSKKNNDLFINNNNNI